MDDIQEVVEVKHIPKDITGLIINQSDQSAVRIEIYDMNKNDKTVWARLYDKDDNLITDRRVYSYEGGYKNIPCDLSEDDLSFFDPKAIEHDLQIQ